MERNVYEGVILSRALRTTVSRALSEGKIVPAGIAPTSRKKVVYYGQKGRSLTFTEFFKKYTNYFKQISKSNLFNFIVFNIIK